MLCLGFIRELGRHNLPGVAECQGGRGTAEARPVNEGDTCRWRSLELVKGARHCDWRGLLTEGSGPAEA